MQQHVFNFGQRANHSVLLSLTHPSKALFQRHRAMFRHAALTGFPSPADDYVDCRLGLGEHFIQHNETTFFMRVSGDSMCGMGIFDADLLVVDRSVPATHGCVVIAVVEGEFTVKQLIQTAQGQVLRAAHPSYPDMLIKPEQDLSIWGVVQWNVHSAK